ncbi:HTH-type transcriptional regulator GltC [Streptomyces netropsis]|uniref:DNA-binding transcriptional LysR family regulator n=1 Tax=Streptomyces syringium TaxID=76729 RepID=A0ABS4XXR6_9ACTN|nr:LysR substrate-binding domain-containing protein [Streptomyces syringium]MBP2401319.1 DNA-binding transcriptional LysR family regulator [Streptomyces syringium]SPE63165.1 HTH-type transcriptional regulator GltC [Streptomyces netropsis]
MELRQLEYFVKVVEEASFTKAAAALHVAQPGISAQIRKLERELGQELLDRSGRTVRPTEAGEAVLPYARAALGAVSGARQAVEELTGLLRGQVTIGTVTSLGPSIDLPALLAGFHHDHPAVEIGLTADTSDRLLEAVAGGRIDLAVVGLAGEPPPGVGVQIVVDEALVVAVSHDDPLAARTTLALGALADRPIMSLPRGTGLRASVENACAAAGFRPHVAFEAGDPNVLAQLAARGLGVAVVPESVARAHAAQLHTVGFRPALRGVLALAWRTEGPVGPAARAVVRHARAHLPEPATDR